MFNSFIVYNIGYNATRYKGHPVLEKKLLDLEDSFEDFGSEIRRRRGGFIRGNFNVNLF